MNRGLRRSLAAGIFVLAGVLGRSVHAFRVFNSTDGALYVAYTSANPNYGDVTCVIPPRGSSGPSSTCFFRDISMDADTFLKTNTFIKVRRHMLDNTANIPDKVGLYDVCTRGSTCEIKNLYVNEDPALPGLILTDIPGQPLR